MFIGFNFFKGALSGLLSGLVLSLWVGVGAQFHPPPPELARPLSLTTEGCNFTTAANVTWTSPPPGKTQAMPLTTVSERTGGHT